MPVNNYLRECKYNLNNLDNYIYLYEFNEPLLDYITDDEESNASASDIKGSAQRLYCESVEYSSTSSVDNRFSFDNTLTVTLAEHSKVSHYSIIQTLLNNNWMVVIKNKEDEAFVVNAEYPVMVSYSYVINDEKTPNILTITFRALQNVPTINLKTSVVFSSTLCDKPCEYVISRIESLKMIDMNKATIDVDGDGFTLNEKGEGNLKTIEFNPTLMSFTDSYDGREFSQTLSFQIPFEMYRFYFHYNLLEYLDNRYYALIKTTNDNNILGGFRQGLFPSYTVSTSDSGNLITINLNAKYASYSVLGSDTMNITTSDGMFYKPVLGECVNKLFTWTLIEQYNANGVATNGFYCLNGFEEIYSDYTILGTYNQFDTNFGFKLVDFNIDCSEGCKINNLPSTIQFQTSGETQCFIIDTNCSVTWEWNAEAIDFIYDEITKEMCVTSKVDDGTFTIKATSTDGTIQYATVVIGSGGITGDTTTTINITAEGQKVSVIPVKGLSNVKSVTSTLQYITNQNGNGYEVTVPENTNEEPRTFTITIIYKDNSIETINIIQDRIYYVTTTSEETECFGNDLYYVNKKYKKYTEDGELIFMENIKGNQKETDSVNCMDYDEKVSGCTSCFEGYIYTLYEYKKNGSTIATRYEKTSSSCTDNASTEYIVNTEKAVCVDGTEYYVEELHGANCNGGDNVKLYPVIERASNTEATDSNVCDTINPNTSGSTLYRWIDTNETYCLTDGNETNCTSSSTRNYCDGYSYFKETTYYVSPLCDGNWEKSGNTQTTLIETNSTHCGYEENVTPNDMISFSWSGSSNTFKLNNTTYQATSTSYTATLDDLNITSLTSCKEVFANIGLTNLYNFPDTSNVTDFQSMFNNCIAVTSLDLSKFDTSSATQMQAMFYYCVKLTSLDLSSFDTSNVYNLSSLFYGCKKLQTLDVSSWDVNHITNSNFYRNMFTDCDSLTTLKVKQGTRNWWCDRLQEAGISCDIIEEVNNGGGSTTGSTTGSTSGGTYECEPISIGDFSYIYYDNCLCVPESYITINGTNYTVAKANNAFAEPGNGTTKTYSLSDFGVSRLNSLSLSGLCGCSWITSMFDTSNITDMSNMFRENNAQECINLSTMNTSSANNMSYMFYQWAKLKNIYLNNWNTSNVTNMLYMFGGCPNLISLDVSSFDTSNVVNMEGMFASCKKLTTLDCSNFNTSNVTNMSDLFSNCIGLITLDVSSWDISKVTYYDNMFYNCTSLQTLRIKQGTRNWWYNKLNSSIRDKVTIIEV